MKKLLVALLLFIGCANAAEPQIDHAFGVSSGAQSLAFSPDHKQLAVAGSDGVKVYEPKTGAVLRTVKGSAWLTSSVAWSPDGKILAIGGLNATDRFRGEIILWRAGKTVHWFCDQSVVASLAFSPDGKLLASATAGDLGGEQSAGSARIWDVANRKLVKTLGNFYGEDAAIRFIKDGKQIAYSSVDGRNETHQTVISDTKTGKLLKRWNESAIPLNSSSGEKPNFAVRQFDLRVRKGLTESIESISGADYMNFRFIARKNGKVISSQDLGGGSGSAIFGGDLVATYSLRRYFPGYEEFVKIWQIEGNPPKLREVRLIGDRTLRATQISSGDGKTLGISTKHGLLLLDNQLNTKQLLVQNHTTTVQFPSRGASFSADGKSVFERQWYDLSGSKPRLVLPTNKTFGFATRATALSPDGQILATQSERNAALVTRNGKISLLPDVLEKEPQQFAWNPNGDKIAVVFGNGTNDSSNGVVIFDKNGKTLLQLKQGEYAFRQGRAVAFSPNGKQLATVSFHQVQIWDAETGALLKSMDVKRAPIFMFGGGQLSTVAWSHDGKTVGAGGLLFENGVFSSRLLFFDAASGKQLTSLPLTIPINNGGQNGWAWLRNNRVATLNGSKVELWNVASRKIEKSRLLQ